MDDSKIMLITFLDYSKTFDFINHDLFNAGHSPLNSPLLSDYLTNLTEKVKLSSKISNDLKITYRVLQDLKPAWTLLFIIFSWDLPNF